MRLGSAEVRWTSRADGDLGWAAADDEVEWRRRRVLDRPWTCLRQVHGADVVVVSAPGDCVGIEADAAITTHPGAALAIFTADCAPIALAGDGVIGAVHAGWRGLAAGVVTHAADAMRAQGATTLTAALGPCIHAECYEFQPADLDAVAGRLGDGVRGTSSRGTPALDLPAAVQAALDRAGVALLHHEDVCTACSADHFSHRARRETERQAMVVWKA